MSSARRAFQCHVRAGGVMLAVALAGLAGERVA